MSFGSKRQTCVLVVLCLGLGCVPPLGGWDVEALLAARPDLAALPGQRIGDLTPYPALPQEGAEDPTSLLLVACRYVDGARLVLRPSGEEWPAELADRALTALAPERLGLSMRLVASGGTRRPSDDRDAERTIRIRSIAAPDAAGPAGLGDTLTLCDVSHTTPGEKGGAATGGSGRAPGAAATEGDAPAPRGELVGGLIRLRRRLPQPTGRVYQASEVEWAAAWLHELAHALGFAGHAATGDSPVHREQSALRALARRALAGETLAAPNLRALYGLAPGTVLGRVALAPSASRLLSQVRALVTARSARAGPVEGPLASVGDREARLAWRWADGVAVEVRFPRWVEELRTGDAVTAEPGPRTRRMLEPRTGSPAPED